MFNAFNGKLLFIYFFILYCFFHLFSFALALDFYYYTPLTYFLIIISVILVFYNIFFKTNLKKYPIGSSLFLIIIIYLIILMFIYSLNFQGYTDLRGRDSLNNVISFSQGIIAWLFIGAGFYFCFEKTKVVYYLLFLVFLVFIYSVKGFGVINHGNLMTQGGAFYTHLISSTYVFYIIFLCHVFLKNPFNYVLFVVSCLLLYMTGGRADLFLYILTIFIYGFFYERNINFFKMIFITLFFGFLIILFFNIYRYTSFGGEADRFLNILFFESSGDTSYIERNEFFNESLVDLKGFLLIGDPNYLIFKYNDLGKYIHNLLSLWQFYGFLFFLLIFMVILFILKRIIGIGDESYKFGLLIFLFSVVSVVFAKSAFYYPFWFSLGYMLMLFSFKKVN